MIEFMVHIFFFMKFLITYQKCIRERKTFINVYGKNYKTQFQRKSCTFINVYRKKITLRFPTRLFIKNVLKKKTEKLCTC